MQAARFANPKLSQPHFLLSRSQRANRTPNWASARTLFRFLDLLLAKFPLLAALAIVLFAFSAMAATPNFVQSNSTVPQTPQTKVTLAYSAAQSAGNFNVVIVGWNDASAQVSSLTDSKGNLYHLAVGPTVLTGSAPLSQAIYYAKNISAAIAGANTVTVNFNAAADYPGHSDLGI